MWTVTGDERGYRWRVLDMICIYGHDHQLYELSGAEFNSISIVIEKRV